MYELYEIKVLRQYMKDQKITPRRVLQITLGVLALIL